MAQGSSRILRLSLQLLGKAQPEALTKPSHNEQTRLQANVSEESHHNCRCPYICMYIHTYIQDTYIHPLQFPKLLASLVVQGPAIFLGVHALRATLINLKSATAITRDK